MSLTDDILMHYGMPRRSGRYPWGSGDNPYQHSGDFLSRVEELKKSNFTFTDKDGKTYTGEVAIAKSMGLSTTQFRTQMSLAKDERRSADVATAKALRAKGYSLNEIADKMGFANDSSVRSLLNESSEARMNQEKTDCGKRYDRCRNRSRKRAWYLERENEPGSLYFGNGRLSHLWRRRPSGNKPW